MSFWSESSPFLRAAFWWCSACRRHRLHHHVMKVAYNIILIIFIHIKKSLKWYQNALFLFIFLLPRFFFHFGELFSFIFPFRMAPKFPPNNSIHAVLMTFLNIYVIFIFMNRFSYFSCRWWFSSGCYCCSSRLWLGCRQDEDNWRWRYFSGWLHDGIIMGSSSCTFRLRLVEADAGWDWERSWGIHGNGCDCGVMNRRTFINF